LRILFVHTKYLHSAGGEDTMLAAEVELLRSKGHEVDILLFDNASMGAGISGKIKAGISAVYNSRSGKELDQHILRFRPDIIHVHNFFFTASPSVFYTARRRKIPIVATLHNFRLVCVNALLLRNNGVCELCLGHSFPWYGVKYKCYHDSALQSAMVGSMTAIHKWIGTWKRVADMFLTPAAFMRTKLIGSSFNAPPEKILVKHNFIRDPGCSPAEGRDDFYLFVGRVSGEKGVDVLLKAFARLPGKRLVLAGDGPEKEMLAASYGQHANIMFAGKKTHEEVIALMKQCRALVFPSICYEGMPLTIIEAFATGTPVISSRLGAMQEMVSDGVNGALFEAGNDADLAKIIGSFEAETERKTSTMYTGARESYLEKYHPEKCYNAIMDIYNQLIIAGKR